MPRNDRFLKACRGESVDKLPVWLMRQAGRYMPEYRSIRKRHSFLEMIGTPEVAAEITLQPVRAFDVDAAIVFSDILPTLCELGFELSYMEKTGPVIANAVRSPDDLSRLRRPGDRGQAQATCDAIRLACEALDGTVPVIGFAGAPFTLAGYAIEGGSSSDFLTTKRFLREHPESFRRLLGHITDAIIEYLAGQVEAGASAIQLFDSLAGVLAPSDYVEYALPYARRIIDSLGKTGLPRIYFSTGTAGMLPLLKNTGADVIGIDWRVSMSHARTLLGPEVTIQGNLDPTALISSGDEMTRQADAVLREINGAPRHVFNLGHGVLKETPVERVRQLVNLVHAYKPARQS